MQMTPRQLREQIDAIDIELGELQPWEKKLTAMRKHYVLNDERDVVNIIENGLRGGQGRPAYADLDPFDDGWPGLNETRQSITNLKERRALLAEQQPSKAETAKRIEEAATRAAEIRRRAKDLATRAEEADAALNTAARLALPVAEESRRLWEENAALDKLTGDADIPRPATPSVSAPHFRLAQPMIALLQWFHGEQPTPFDATVRQRFHTEIAKGACE